MAKLTTGIGLLSGPASPDLAIFNSSSGSKEVISSDVFDKIFGMSSKTKGPLMPCQYTKLEAAAKAMQMISL